MIEKREVRNIVEVPEVENPYREYITERAERTRDLLELESDGFDYRAHAAYFYGQAVEALLAQEDFTDYESVQRWDELHLQVGYHATMSGDRQLFAQCFGSLVDNAAKWCLGATDLVEGRGLTTDKMVAELTDISAQAERDNDYGTLASIHSLLLQIDQHKQQVKGEDMPVRTAEIEAYATKTHSQDEALRYMALWSQDEQLPEGQELVSPDDFANVREQYAQQIGVYELDQAVTSDLSQNLAAALYMVRHDFPPVPAFEPQLQGVTMAKVRENIQLQLRVTRYLPWSLRRVTLALELVEAAETCGDQQLAHEAKTDLLVAWHMVAVTTDLKSHGRQQMHEETKLLIPKVGPMDGPECETVLYDGPNALRSPRWPRTF